VPLQSRAIREYAAKRGWTIAMQVKEAGSGASQRELRERFLERRVGVRMRAQVSDTRTTVSESRLYTGQVVSPSSSVMLLVTSRGPLAELPLENGFDFVFVGLGDAHAHRW
jgi:hypothetical protein